MNILFTFLVLNNKHKNMRTTAMLFISFFFVISFVSCDKTIEDRIRNEFKIYVNENFGSPSDLKEIVSISLKDSIGFQQMKRLGLEALKLDSILNDMNSKNFEWINNSSKNMSHAANENIGELRSAIEDNIEYLHFGLPKYYSAKNNLEKQLEQNDSTRYVHYKIKARVKIGENKKINTYHAYIDNNGKIKITDNELKISEMPDSWKEITSDIDAFIAEAEKRKEILFNMKKAIVKLK